MENQYTNVDGNPDYIRGQMQLWSNTNTRNPDYIRWKQMQLWLNTNTRNLDKRQIYELYNIVSRYVISSSIPHESYLDGSLNEQQKSKVIHDKYLSELVEKRIEIPLDITKISSKKIYANKIPTTLKVSGSQFIFGDFLAIIHSERYAILRNLATREEIHTTLMKYAYSPSKSMSWQIPIRVYQQMYEKHGLTLEGCASPFNSQTIAIFPKNQGRFCSPFESDKIYGSIGSIFDVELEGEIAMINPPYVEDFMESVGRKVIKTLDNATKPTIIVSMMPAWTDAPSHEQYCNSIWLKQRFDLAKNEHYYEESDTRKQILSKFGSTLFVLSNTDVDFSDLPELFKINS